MYTCVSVCRYYAVAQLPQWITEVGTNDMTVQGVFPDHMFSALAAQTVVPALGPVLWFCWSDAMVAPFGLTDASDNPKPSYFSFTNFTGATRA